MKKLVTQDRRLRKGATLFELLRGTARAFPAVPPSAGYHAFCCFLLFLLGAAGTAKAQQHPPTCISSPDVISGQPNWNWEVDLFDPSYRKTWSAYTYSSAVGSNSAVLMGAPWYTNNTDQIAQIGATKDYTKAKGWRLVRVNFGCAAAEENPWFVLYNQYTGVLRVFVWINNTLSMNQGALISLKQTGNRITALGSNSSALLNAPDYYLNNAVPAGSDYVSALVTTAGAVKWASADFQTTFDPNASNSLFTGTELVFEVQGIQSSTIDLAGKFKFTTDEATPAIAGQPTPTPGVSRGNTFVADGKKVIAKINNGVKGTQSVLEQINKGATELAKLTFKGAYKAPGAHGNIKKDIYDLAAGLVDATTVSSATSNGSGLQRVLAKVLKVGTGLADAIPALSFLGPVLGIMFPSEDDKTAKSIPFTPTISTGDMSLTGEIKTVTAQNTLRIQLPGTTHNSNAPTTLPFYNCMLGVFNISNTPVLQKSTPQAVRVELGYVDDYDWFNQQWVQWPYSTDQSLSTFKLSNDLHPVFNASAGVTPISVQGAIVFRRTNTPSDNPNGERGDATTDLLADPYTCTTCPTDPNLHITRSANPTLQEFAAGNLIVNKMDPTSIEFQTPFVNLNCMQSVTARVPADVTAFVRVRAIFRRNDAPNEPPLVLVFDYNTVTTPNAAVTHAYEVVGTADDAIIGPGFLWGSGYQTLTIYGDEFSSHTFFGPGAGSAGDNRTIHSSESIEVIGEVEMPFGTTLALINSFQPNSCPGAALAASVSGTGCDANPDAWWRAGPDTPAAASSGNPKLEVFPNPATGVVNVNPPVAMGEEFNLTILDFLGRVVHAEHQNYHGTAIAVNVAMLPTGVYVVRITSAASGVHTAKLAIAGAGRAQEVK